MQQKSQFLCIVLVQLLVECSIICASGQFSSSSNLVRHLIKIWLKNGNFHAINVQSHSITRDIACRRPMCRDLQWKYHIGKISARSLSLTPFASYVCMNECARIFELLCLCVYMGNAWIGCIMCVEWDRATRIFVSNDFNVVVHLCVCRRLSSCSFSLLLSISFSRLLCSGVQRFSEGLHITYVIIVYATLYFYVKPHFTYIHILYLYTCILSRAPKDKIYTTMKSNNSNNTSSKTEKINNSTALL